jgi:Lysophospholipase L1 and related esterases
LHNKRFEQEIMKIKFDLKSVCSFGDSIMKGIVVEEKTVQPLKFKYKISEAGFVNVCEDSLGMNILNYACFGGTVAQGMKGMNRHLDAIRQSEYVVFEYGGNDCDFNWAEVSEQPDSHHDPKTPINVFISKYAELINRVKEMQIKPIMLSLPMVDADRFFETISQGLNRDNILKWLGGNTSYIDHWHEGYNVEVFKLARLMNVPIIDITTPFLTKKNYRDFLCEDGMHPNEKGHQLIAEAICSHYKKMVAAN